MGVKETVDEFLFSVSKGVVQSGPFAGMLMSPVVVWGSNSLSAMLLGSFEEELHDSIEREIRRLQHLSCPKIVNVGCSEGYYAIGFARRVPDAIIYAVDTSDESLIVAKGAAELNDVQSRILVEEDLNTVFAAPDLVVMDCEGAEIEYLDLERFPALAHASIIVEVHNFPDRPRADEILFSRFKETHSIKQVIESGRNPNKHSILIQQTSVVRWAAVCEYRPCLMDWLVMTPYQPRFNNAQAA